MRAKVKELYNIPRVGASDTTQALFKLPVEKRLKRGITYLKEWYAVAKRALSMDKELQGPRQLTLQEAWRRHRPTHTDIHMFNDTIRGSRDTGLKKD